MAESPPTLHPGPLYALACSGGGVTGAYQVGVLNYIHEHFCRDGRSPFQIFSGVSCGALNTTFFACEAARAQQSRLRLVALWEQFHVPEYHQDIWKSMRSSLFRLFRQARPSKKPLWSLYDPTPMMEIIHEGLKREHLEEAFQTGATLGVAVAATEIINCLPCWFVEGPRAVAWQRFHSVGLLSRISPLHVAASCSVPFFMPPVRIGEYCFVDGSVKLERPFSAAISMGATRILNISTHARVVSLPIYEANFEPTYATLVRFMLRAFTQDLSVSEAEQIRVANRFAAHLRQEGQGRLQPPTTEAINALFDARSSPTAYQPIEIFLMAPSRSPESLFREFQAEQRRASPQHPPQTFMFHRDFIRRLIQLGFDEARAKHEELRRFFSGDTAA